MSTTSSTPVLDNKAGKKRKVKGASATPPAVAEAKANGTAEHEEGNSVLRELQK